MTPAKQIFEYLPGIWSLSRQTFTSLMQWDRSGGECIKGSGYAVFEHPKDYPKVLVYTEKVTITADESNSAMNGMEATQRYLYRFNDENSTLTKHFYDDRLFYEVDVYTPRSPKTSASGFGEVLACGEHWCNRDFYESSYTFKDEDSFRLVYSVNGPKKSYEIQNEYKRLGADEIKELGIVVAKEEVQ